MVKLCVDAIQVTQLFLVRTCEIQLPTQADLYFSKLTSHVYCFIPGGVYKIKKGNEKKERNSQSTCLGYVQSSFIHTKSGTLVH